MDQTTKIKHRLYGFREPSFVPDGYLTVLDALALAGPLVLGLDWTGDEVTARSPGARERAREAEVEAKRTYDPIHGGFRVEIDPAFIGKDWETRLRDARAARVEKDRREDEARERRGHCVDMLRQALFSGRVLSLVLSKDGQKHLIGPAFWGSEEATQVFDKGTVTIDKGSAPLTQYTVKGHVLLSRRSLESTFDIKTKGGARRRGRKPLQETHRQEILDQFQEMVANGEVSFDHGGKEAAIQALAPNFPEYQARGIRSIIEPDYDAMKAKNKQKKTAIK